MLPGKTPKTPDLTFQAAGTSQLDNTLVAVGVLGTGDWLIHP